MMDFHKLLSRYRQFGRLQLVWQYAKLGVLPVIIKDIVGCVVKRQSFKTIYPKVLMRIEPYLIERFQVSRFKETDFRMSIRRLYGGAGYSERNRRHL